MEGRQNLILGMTDKALFRKNEVDNYAGARSNEWLGDCPHCRPRLAGRCFWGRQTSSQQQQAANQQFGNSAQ